MQIETETVTDTITAEQTSFCKTKFKNFFHLKKKKKGRNGKMEFKGMAQ